MIERELFDEFGHLVNQMTSKVESNATSSLALTRPFMSMFSDCATCARKNFNSGCILLHRQKSRQCLKEWRYYFDDGAEWAVYDQRHLRSLEECKIHKLPEWHRMYPTWKDMRTKRSTTVIHNTNTYGSHKIPEHVQRKYFEHLLGTAEFSEVEHF